MVYRVGSDIGGTFTDLILASEDGQTFQVGKVLTTPERPDDAVIAGIESVLAATGVAPGQVSHVLHGTTLFTNAIIERKGARTALVTTRGFRDAVEIAREHRYDMYDLYMQRPRPLAPRHLRFELDERVLASGTVRQPMDPEQVRRLADRLRAERIEAVGVCLLHAYANPTHERLAGIILREALPEVAVTLSSELVPEIREYERTSTTLANVYVQRLAQRYLERLGQRLRRVGVAGGLFIMQSNGGLCEADTGGRYPVRLIESGPAAGALAAAHYGALLGHRDLLSFDMGGTTAKACVIADGEPLVSPEFEIDRRYHFKKGSGLPIKVPVIEMIEIGTGGGSIARVDALRRLRVGPESAGARPGPAAYSLGGTEPTVTDADLVLGYLDPDFFLGGQMRLDREAARRAIAERVGRPLGLDLVEAAWGIHQLANENMAGAARIHAIERGKDVERFPIFAFGGAGPVHAFGVARILRSPRVIYPLGAGVTSAVGFLVAPLSFDFVRTLPGDLAAARLGRRRPGGGRDGGGGTRRPRPDDPRRPGPLSSVRRHALPEAGLRDSRTDPGGAARRFPARGGPPELRARVPRDLRPHRPRRADRGGLVARGRPGAPADAPAADGSRCSAGTRGRRGKVSGASIFPTSEGYADVPVYDRYALGTGATIEGPAVIEERESTVVVSAAAAIRVDAASNVIVEVPPAAGYARPAV